MPEDPCTVLLVDDDRASREAMAEWLRSEGFGVITATNGEDAIRHLHDGIAVVVTDLKMPHTDGLALLHKAKEEAPDAAVILVSGYGTVDTAVTALKDGAFDFLTKPVKPEELTHRIRMALERRSMAAEIARLHVELSQRNGFENIVGSSAAMRDVFERIRLVADRGRPWGHLPCGFAVSFDTEHRAIVQPWRDLKTHKTRLRPPSPRPHRPDKVCFVVHRRTAQGSGMETRISIQRP